MASEAQVSNTRICHVMEPHEVMAQLLGGSIGFVVTGLERLITHKHQVQKTTILPSLKPYEVTRNLFLGCC